MDKAEKKFILSQKCHTTTFYLCEYGIDKQDCGWVLSSSSGQIKSRAFVFTHREKAENVAKILNSQCCCEGGQSNYSVESL